MHFIHFFLMDRKGLRNKERKREREKKDTTQLPSRDSLTKLITDCVAGNLNLKMASDAREKCNKM